MTILEVPSFMPSSGIVSAKRSSKNNWQRWGKWTKSHRLWVGWRKTLTCWKCFAKSWLKVTQSGKKLPKSWQVFFSRSPMHIFGQQQVQIQKTLLLQTWKSIVTSTARQAVSLGKSLMLLRHRRPHQLTTASNNCVNDRNNNDNTSQQPLPPPATDTAMMNAHSAPSQVTPLRNLDSNAEAGDNDDDDSGTGHVTHALDQAACNPVADQAEKSASAGVCHARGVPREKVSSQSNSVAHKTADFAMWKVALAADAICCPKWSENQPWQCFVSLEINEAQDTVAHGGDLTQSNCRWKQTVHMVIAPKQLSPIPLLSARLVLHHCKTQWAKRQHGSFEWILSRWGWSLSSCSWRAHCFSQGFAQTATEKTVHCSGDCCPNSLSFSHCSAWMWHQNMCLQLELTWILMQTKLKWTLALVVFFCFLFQEEKRLVRQTFSQCTGATTVTNVPSSQWRTHSPNLRFCRVFWSSWWGSSTSSGSSSSIFCPRKTVSQDEISWQLKKAVPRCQKWHVIASSHRYSLADRNAQTLKGSNWLCQVVGPTGVRWRKLCQASWCIFHCNCMTTSPSWAPAWWSKTQKWKEQQAAKEKSVKVRAASSAASISEALKANGTCETGPHSINLTQLIPIMIHEFE